MYSRNDEEEYLYKKLERELKKSSVNKMIAEKIESELGEWTTVKKSAEFLKKHKNTVYTMIHSGILITRKSDRAIRILSKSLIFALGDIEIY